MAYLSFFAFQNGGHFYDSCIFRTPFRKIPHVEGKEIDLYLLYWLVTAQGGWEKVRISWSRAAKAKTLPAFLTHKMTPLLH